MILQFAGDFFSDRTHHIGSHLSTFTDLCIGRIEASTPPPAPRAFDFLKIVVQIPRYPGENAV